MIKSIYIRNFKSLKEARLDLGSLNVLAGLNGMGKSSLIQTLLLLKQSTDLSRNNILQLNSSEFVSLGKGKDIFYQFAEDQNIQFKISNSETTVNWNFEYDSDSEFLSCERSYPEEIIERFNLFSSNFQYLNAERIGPRQSYESSSYYIENKGQIGNKGEYAVHYLNVFGNKRIKSDFLNHSKAKSNSLIHLTDAWLGEISPGTKLNTRTVPGTEMVLLDIQFETGADFTNSFRPVNVGFGITFVLPVILSLLMAKRDRLIIIENPEAHLHPRGQAEMGRLIALAAKTGAQILIETHSDHILNGIRVAIKNGEIASETTKIFFFDRVNTNYEQYSSVTPINIDSNGELDKYPPNFLDEWNNQLFKLL
jgi:predicted ATPase